MAPPSPHPARASGEHVERMRRVRRADVPHALIAALVLGVDVDEAHESGIQNYRAGADADHGTTGDR